MAKRAGLLHDIGKSIDHEVEGSHIQIGVDLCKKYTKLVVRTNADTPHDAEVARSFGAVGIGLCRTEHMFFENEKIKAMREMILSDTIEDREKALDKLLPYQKQDFIVPVWRQRDTNHWHWMM
jgi:pyruvate,orthophosphate dikinase